MKETKEVQLVDGIANWMIKIFPKSYTNNSWPHGMCYSHYGNGVHNGAISIAQWGLLSGCYKVCPLANEEKF